MPKGYYVESGRTPPAGSPSHAGPARAITLCPAQLVAGICFHLVEEHFASGVDARSIARQLARLELERLQVMISRHEWRGMTNRQRLQCLLSATEIAFVLIGDGRAALLANKS